MYSIFLNTSPDSGSVITTRSDFVSRSKANDRLVVWVEAGVLAGLTKSLARGVGGDVTLPTGGTGCAAAMGSDKLGMVWS